MAITYTSKFSGREIDEKLEQVNSLQEEVNKLKDSTDVVDVVGTYNELEHYDFTTLTINDIIKVLKDETKKNQTTYYRLMDNSPDTPIDDGVWEYVGAVDGYLGYENNVDNKIILQSSARVKIGSSDKTKIGYSSTGNVDHYDGDSSGHTDTGRVCWEFEHNKATLRASNHSPIIQYVDDVNDYFQIKNKNGNRILSYDSSNRVNLGQIGSSIKIDPNNNMFAITLNDVEIFENSDSELKIRDTYAHEIVTSTQSSLKINTASGDNVFIADVGVTGGINVSDGNTSVINTGNVNLIPNFSSGSINELSTMSDYDRIKIGGYEIVSNEDIQSGDTKGVMFAYKPANSEHEVVPFAITTDGKAYYQGKELNTGGSEIKIIELPANSTNSEPPFKLPDGITYDDFDKDVIIHVTGSDFSNDVYISGSNMALLPMDGGENPPLAKVFCWTMLNMLLALIVLEDNTYMLSNETLGFDSNNTYDKEQINSFLNEKADITVTDDLYNQISDLSSAVNNKANSSDLNNYYTKSQTENLIATSGGGSGSSKVITIVDPGDYEEHELPDGLTYESFTDGTIIKLVQTSSDDSGNVIAQGVTIYEHEGTLETTDGSEGYKSFKKPMTISAEEFNCNGNMPTLPYIEGNESIIIHLTNGVCTFKKTTSYYSNSTKRLNEFIVSEFNSVWETIGSKAEQSDVDTLKSKIKTIDLWCDDDYDMYKSNTIHDLPEGVTYDDFDEYAVIALHSVYTYVLNHLNGYNIYINGSSMATGQMKYTDDEGNTSNVNIKQFTYTVPTETCMMTYIVVVGDINKYMWYKTYSSDYYYTKNETDSVIDEKIAAYMTANYENGDNGSY